MDEKEWTISIKEKLEKEIDTQKYEITCGERVPYTANIGLNQQIDFKKYETDLLIKENVDGSFIPRLIIESKYLNVTTHDTIAYNNKALAHKNLYMGLRYGLMIGNSKSKITPKVLQHGMNFDFMMAFENDIPTEKEWELFVRVVKNNLEIASKYSAFMEKSRGSNITCIEKNITFHNI